jgi:beta-galactosidase GanA
MASRYGSHPAVAGWQIDNELGWGGTARCYCETCANAFRHWLEARYETMDALNDAWGTIFWSQTYGDWTEIDLPNLTIAEPNPSHVLDYYRSCSDALVAYQQLQHSTIKSLISERQIVTTNFMSQFTDLDYHDLAKPLDLVTMSHQPPGRINSLHAQSSAGYVATLLYPYITVWAHAYARFRRTLVLGDGAVRQYQWRYWRSTGSPAMDMACVACWRRPGFAGRPVWPGKFHSAASSRCSLTKLRRPRGDECGSIAHVGNRLCATPSTDRFPA